MTDTPEYTPPKVWTWNKPSGGRFANINRPIAGRDARQGAAGRQASAAALFAGHAERREGHDHARGAAGARPQGRRVRCLADQDRRRRPVRQRLRRGQSELQDPGAAGPQRAQADPRVRVRRDPGVPRREVRRVAADRAAARAECLSWLFWQMGSAPYLGGGFGHFYAYAPIKIEYAIDRFAMETKRQLDVLDRRLAESEYVAGADYTIADIAILAVVRRAGEGRPVRRRPNSSRCTSTRTCSAGPTRSLERPAVKRGRMVNRAVRRARRASCTSATTPATSTRRRRTSSLPPTEPKIAEQAEWHERRFGTA